MADKTLSQMAEKNTQLTQDSLRALFDYDPETGHFTPKVRRLGSAATAGYYTADGYLRIRIGKKNYANHRLAWLWVHGELPAGYIDHINGVRDDNRIANLRVVTRAANQQNRTRPRRDNKSGLMGVSVNRCGGFLARIFKQGKSFQLGTFSTAQEAHQAYLAAKRALHEGAAFANSNAESTGSTS